MVSPVGKLLMASAIIIPAYASAQGRGAGEGLGKAGVKADDPTDLDVNVRDPGNSTAKAVAEYLGITVGEATSRLQAQARSAKLTERLSARFPDTFAGLRFEQGRALRIRALFKGQPDSAAVAQASSESGIGQPVEAAVAVMSHRDERAFIQAMSAELRRLGRQEVAFSVEPETGTVTIGAADDPALRAAAERAGSSIREVRFDPTLKVELTAYSIAGQAFNADGSQPEEGNACTTGFSMLANSVRYATTAGHCDNARGDFNAYMDTLYGTGNRFNYIDQHKASGVDIQWMTLAESDDQTSPHYWNGDVSVGITSTFKTAPGIGISLCKWGRMTKWDCGTVTGTVTAYGGTMYLLSNSSVDMSIKGDSGGPVATGATAYGMIHGRTASSPSKAVFFTIQNLYAATPLRLLLCTTC